MMRAWLAALALLAAPSAAAEDVAGFVHGGVGAAWREPSNDPPYDLLQLEYDTGTVLFAEVASRYEGGFMLRVEYAYTFHDTLAGSGGLVIEEDIEQHDARVGAFYAPWPRGPLEWRIGAGYLYAEENAEGAQDRSQDGGFVEGGLTWHATKRLAFDAALGGLKVEGDGDYDAEGTEARLAAALAAGGVEFTLGARYRALERERPFDEEVLELRVGVGGAWGWENN